jgi:CheY-like chemotaxis protein
MVKNILLVDDDQRFLEALAEALREHGDQWNILAAGNGKQGAEIIASRSVDLVVTDLRMPAMDGYDLLAFIKKKKPDTPVVVMTADDSREVEQRLLSHGITQCLIKPVNYSEVVRAIARQFAMSRPPGRS